MKKLFLLLLLSPLAYSDVYTFSCKLDEGENLITSIKIDTSKKYIELHGHTRFDNHWNETDTLVKAWNDTYYNLELNKITGRAQQAYGARDVIAYYTCEAVKPLMP